MSKTKIVTFVCWLVTSLAIIGLAAWLIFGNVINVHGGWFEFGSFDVSSVHSVPAEDIENLSIDWVSGAITVGVHDGDEIIITELSRRELRDRDRLTYSVSNGRLSIGFSEGRTRMNPPAKQLEVLLPTAHESDEIDDERIFADFNITTVSGRVIIDDINADNLSVRTTSGRIELSNSTTKNIELQTTSGRIELENVFGKNANLRTVSGRIVAESTHLESINTHTTSGRHELAGRFYDVESRSTSGRLVIASSIVPDRVEARTTSGRIAVTVPRDEAISVDYSITSGRFSSEIPVITHGGNNAQFRLRTTSGRISIFEYNGLD